MAYSARFVILTLASLLLTATILGCQDRATSTSADGNESEGGRSPAAGSDDGSKDRDETGRRQDSPVPDPREEVTVTDRDWKGVEELIDAQRGKVVVVDLWSTWCGPCMREFPHLVALQRKYPERVACISVNVNYDGLAPELDPEIREQIMQFLRKQDARIRNVICTVSSDELSRRLDFASIPVVYVYDRQGELRRRFDNEDALSREDEFTYRDDVIPLVERLLEESSG